MVLVHVYSVALCQLGSHDSVLLTIRAETNKHSIRLIVPEFHGYLESDIEFPSPPESSNTEPTGPPRVFDPMPGMCVSPMRLRKLHNRGGSSSVARAEFLLPKQPSITLYPVKRASPFPPWTNEVRTIGLPISANAGSPAVQWNWRDSGVSLYQAESETLFYCSVRSR